MKTEILSLFQGENNVKHVFNVNGTESWQTQEVSFNDMAFATGACKLNTIDNEKKHVLFLFNDKNDEIGRFYICKSLQGKSPSELADLKQRLVIFKGWNPRSKQWVPCVGLSTSETHPNSSAITIDEPFVQKKTVNNTFDVNESLKKHALSFMFFGKDSDFNFYSVRDQSLMWGYKNRRSFYKGDRAVFGLSTYFWVQTKLNAKEDFCWFFDFLNKKSMNVWEGLQRNPEELVSEIIHYVPSFKLTEELYKLQKEIQYAWTDLQSFIMFVSYCTFNMDSISGREVLNLRECTSYEDIATLICSDMHLTETDSDQKPVHNQDVELPF